MYPFLNTSLSRSNIARNRAKVFVNFISGLCNSYLYRILRYQDYYNILDVSRNVHEAELKRQYHKLALQVHPDKNRAPKADIAFQGILGKTILGLVS